MVERIPVKFCILDLTKRRNYLLTVDSRLTNIMSEMFNVKSRNFVQSLILGHDFKYRRLLVDMSTTIKRTTALLN